MQREIPEVLRIVYESLGRAGLEIIDCCAWGETSSLTRSHFGSIAATRSPNTRRRKLELHSVEMSTATASTSAAPIVDVQGAKRLADGEEPSAKRSKEGDVSTQPEFETCWANTCWVVRATGS